MRLKTVAVDGSVREADYSDIPGFSSLKRELLNYGCHRPDDHGKTPCNKKITTVELIEGFKDS